MPHIDGKKNLSKRRKSIPQLNIDKQPGVPILSWIAVHRKEQIVDALMVGIVVVLGYICLMVAVRRIPSIIFWVVTYLLAAFWTWGGWVIIQDSGAAGLPMFSSGLLLMVMLIIVFLYTVVLPMFHRRNSN